jgi:hypothetical protein
MAKKKVDILPRPSTEQLIIDTLNLKCQSLQEECNEWRKYVEDTEKHLTIRAEREVTRLTKIIINMTEHHFE